MEELVIVLADLYLTRPADARSVREVALPGLGRMARFGRARSAGRDWRSWLAEWAGLADLAARAPATIAAAGRHPAGAAALHAGTSDPGMVWLATPVHLVAGLSSVHLDARGLLPLEPDTRRRLAEDFNRVFAGSGFALEALASAGFLVTTPPLAAPPTTDPARLLGSTVGEALPAPSDAPELRRLGAEIEMWLHEHPVNIERAGHGRLPVTALWLWGGGPAPGGADETREPAAREGVGRPLGEAYGGDPYLHGLWAVAGRRVRELPSELDQVLAGATSRAVLLIELSHVLDAQRDWSLRDALADTDRRWIVTAVEALGRRDIARITVVANDRALSLAARDRLKLWRTPRPALAALQ